MENHNHEKSHVHEHGHNHNHRITSLNKAFQIAIALNLGFVIIEFIFGFLYDSLGLISDAGHNLSDVVSLILAMLAFKLAKVHANKKYTYGYKKSTILISLLNAVILLVAVGIIISESIEKFSNPQPVSGGVIAWVAGIGVLINGATAWMFIKDKKKDLNVKGAYLHMVADALVSVGVVISGLIITFTGWYIIDPIIGLVVAVIIIISTWDLLRDSLRLSMDGVPANVNYEKVVDAVMKNPEVKDIHHLHIWAISTTENALTAHIAISDFSKIEQVKKNIKEVLRKEGIEHATLEFEYEDCKCENDCL